MHIRRVWRTGALSIAGLCSLFYLYISVGTQQYYYKNGRQIRDYSEKSNSADEPNIHRNAYVSEVHKYADDAKKRLQNSKDLTDVPRSAESPLVGIVSNYSAEVLKLYNSTRRQYSINLNNVTAKVKFPVVPDPNNFCGPEIWMTVFVMSMPGNRELRNSIRETWAHPLYALNGRVIFVLGQTLKGSNQEGCVTGHAHELITEYNSYGDLLISNQIEDYDRLPWKVAAVLLWAAINCEAQFYMKTDDDMLVLPPKIHELLHRFNAQPQMPAIYGHCYDWAPVNRQGKWAISRDVVPEDYFPRYCAGAGYILSIVMDACNLGYKIMYHRPGYTATQLQQLWRDLPNIRNFVCWRPNCYFASGKYCYAFINCAYKENEYS